MTTPKLVMPELSVSQASKEITHNQALAILDQVAQLTVISRLNTPPGSPANGDAYIVGTSPTGAWTGKANQIAYWLTAVNSWQFIVPANGWLAWSNADAKTYRLESSIWVELATGGGGITLPVVRAITANENLALSNINTFGFNSTASNYVSTIPAQSTVAWTADAEMHFKAASTGTITITAATGVTLNGVLAGSLTLYAGAAGSIKRKASDAWEAIGQFGVTNRFSAVKTANQSAGASAFTKVTFDSEEYDIGSSFELANSRMVCNKAGTYAIACNAALAFTTDGDNGSLRVYKNGVQVRYVDYATTGPITTTVGMSGSAHLQLIVGDIIEIYVYNGSLGARDIVGNAFGATVFSASEIL